MATSNDSVGRGDVVSVKASTTTELAVGDVLCWDGSGWVDKVVGQAPTTLASNQAVAGVALTKKASQDTAASTAISVQTSGLASVKVTEEGAGTTEGTALRVSQSTAGLATVLATYGSTAAHRPQDANYLGAVITPSQTTGASPSVATTAAVVNLKVL